MLSEGLTRLHILHGVQRALTHSQQPTKKKIYKGSFHHQLNSTERTPRAPEMGRFVEHKNPSLFHQP